MILIIPHRGVTILYTGAGEHENDNRFHSQANVKSCYRSRYALAFRATIQNVHGDTLHDTSERSERVLNSLAY